MSDKANDPTLIPLGTELGNFKLDLLLGEGGFGAVFRAHNKFTRKFVAVKILKTEGLSAEALERFKREAFISNEIDNPHLVETFEYGEYNGSPFIIMELLDGKPLRHVVEINRRLTPGRARDIAVQVAEALAAAHGRGVIHRDLKPDNIFLTVKAGQDDFVKVLDFGVAKVTGADMEDKLKTATQALVGTPSFMSPEQCRSSKIDARSDVYALGVNLYYMLSGSFPFHGSSFMEIASAHMRDPVPPLPTTGQDGIPSDLVAIVRKAMEKRPEDRFQSMDEMRAALLAARVAIKRGWLTASAGSVALTAGIIVVSGSALGYWVMHRASSPAPPRTAVTPVPAPLETFRVFVDVKPHDAVMFVDGKTRPERPALIEAAPGTRIHVEAEKAGYTRQAQDITVGHEDQRVVIDLPAEHVPAAPPTEAAPRPESGKLVINVEPWADVLVDGAKKDSAPCSLKLPAGVHRITLVNGALHRREEIKVTLSGGGVKKIDRDWRPHP